MFFVHEEAPTRWQRWVLKLPGGELRLYFSALGVGMLTLKPTAGWKPAPQDEPPFEDGEVPWPGLVEELCAFFQGREIKGKYPLLAGDYSPWTLKVLELAVAIPFGQTSTYGEIARAAGKRRGARAAGQALSRNRTPLLVPCHRVIGSKGNLGGFALGLDWKRRLLALEGNKR